MAAPVVASHTSPTTLSVALANAWGVTLAGYVRRGSLSLYAGRERVSDTEEAMDAHS
jgi:FdhD protein